MKLSYKLTALILGILGVAIIILFIRVHTLNKTISLLENKIASTTEELRINIQKNSDTLSNTLKLNVGNIEQKLVDYKHEVGTVSNTVTTLQKLSKTDPELLAKYSKIFFLNENYAPARLFDIPSQYKYSDTRTIKVNEPIWQYLQKMIDNATNTDIKIYVDSGYRSFNEQQALKSEYKIIYGAGTANQFSADQGYSEHQLGTTVDLTTQGLGGNLEGFEKTKAYAWLNNNAYHFGFILSYPQNNKFYVFEPWHWRFVGVKLATYLHKENKNFYDMDQRDIDEYLVSIFD